MSLRLILSLALLLCAKLIPMQFWLSLSLFILSYLIAGADVLWRALRNILRGKLFDENFLMAIATVGAFGIGDYAEGIAVMLFYQFGEMLQDLAVSRSRRSITALMDIRPDFARKRENGALVTCKPESVALDEVIVVNPGERIPLDGVVVKGSSFLDTSALTGESAPRAVFEESEVLSGSINQNATLEIRVTKVFHDSTVSKILSSPKTHPPARRTPKSSSPGSPGSTPPSSCSAPFSPQFSPLLFSVGRPSATGSTAP